MSGQTPVRIIRDKSGPKANPPAPGKETDDLLERAAKKDQSCLPQVRALLDEAERGELTIDVAGSSAESLRQSIAEKASGGNVLGREAIMRKIAKVRAELEGPNPTPIERLLAERASICWYVVHWDEQKLINTGSTTFTQIEYLQRRLDRSHKRFLSAVDTLARVRKLAVPILQVNVARNQQINAVGGRSD